MVTPSTPGAPRLRRTSSHARSNDVPAVDLVVERVEASGRRPLGRPVQLELKLSGRVMGVVSHRGIHRPVPSSASTRCGRGPSLVAGLCCPRPSNGTTTPSATLPARYDFPFERLYAPAAPGPQ